MLIATFKAIGVVRYNFIEEGVLSCCTSREGTKGREPSALKRGAELYWQLVSENGYILLKRGILTLV